MVRYHPPRAAGRSGAKGVFKAAESFLRWARKHGPRSHVTVTIRHKPGMPKHEFNRKVNALKRLGDEGKLFKARNPVSRDREVTRAYRQDVIRRIHAQYGRRNPEFSRRLIDRVTRRMQPDHVHELQLGGLDMRTNLRFLDSFTNRDIGNQIWQQIRNLPDGTPIRIRVIR